ncbi:MAG TPA: RND family transporter [Deltaproteobacteria bacterium]|nr:RND family transporter [Deltaproteobacteria bacterium]
MEKGLARWVLEYRWLVIAATLVAAAVSASGARYLWFSTDYRYFFSKENPQLLAFEALQNTYAKNDNVLFALAPRDGDVFTRRTLAAVEELTKAAWQTPHSLRVDSITNFQYTSADGDDLLVRDLVKDAASLDDGRIEEIRKVALSEPLLVNRLVSRRGHVTGVNVTINLPGRDSDEVPAVAAFSRELAAKMREKYPDIDIYLSGIVMMNNAFSEAAVGDQKSLVPVMFLVIVAVTALLLRSWAATVGTVLVIVLSPVTAMGLAGWLGIPLTGPSSSAPTIIITLAVADCIHILITMAHEMERGLKKSEALVESLRINLKPVFLTSLTTAIGFLSMNWSDAQPFRDLGNIAAMGVTAAFLYSVLFMPAVVSLLPVRVHARAAVDRPVVMERFGDFVVRNRRPLFYGTLAVMVLLMSGIARITFDDRFVEYFDERYSFRTDTDFIAENLTGIYLIEYSLDSGESGGVSEPAFLQKVSDFADWYRRQPRVMNVNTITDTLKRLNRNMHGDDPAFYRLPEERELAAQYLLLYEMSLPYGLDLNNQINVDKSSTRFTVTLENLSTKELLGLEERAQQWLADNAPRMRTLGAGPSIMFSHIAERNIKSMLTGTAAALVLISAILVVALRSLRIGLVSLVPNLSPPLMAFGLWGLLFSEVGLALSVVTAMCLGIVVDDTVHFLSKYLRARRELGLDAAEAVRYSFRTVGTALWVTSAILVAGFLVLTRSGFTINADMGLLSAVALVLALAADFLFLPPLLMKIEEGR